MVDLPVLGIPATIKRRVRFTPFCLSRSIRSLITLAQAALSFAVSFLDSPSVVSYVKPRRFNSSQISESEPEEIVSHLFTQYTTGLFLNIAESLGLKHAKGARASKT